MKLIRITRWGETFENADTRKRQRLKSFHCPSGIESRGLLNLLCHFDNKDALAAFGVFQLICQLSATLPADHRGSLVHSDFSPMSEEFLARLLRIEICHLSAALEILADERVGWIKIMKSADDLPTTCRPHAGFVQGEGEGEGEGEREEKGSSLPIPNEWDDLMPTSTATLFEAITKRINELDPRWKPTLTYAEQHDIHANARFLLDLTDADWVLLKAYMHAVIPDSLGSFYRPASRGRVIQQISDLLTHASNWRAACKREGITTDLDRKSA